MKMKDVCEKFDMTPDTIRYYEKVGLIGKVPRDRNGYRNFSDKNIAEIYFSKVMRSAGIPVQTLADYIKLIEFGEETVSERKNILIKERDTIENEIEKLQSTLNMLDNKINNYEERILSYETSKLSGEV